MFRVKDCDVFPGTSQSFFHSHNLLKTNHLPIFPNNYKKPQKKRLLFFLCLYPETTCRTPRERNLFYRPFALCMVFFKLQVQGIDFPRSLPETANDQNRITLRGLPDVAITHAAALTKSDCYLNFLADVEHIPVELFVFVVQLPFAALTGNKFFNSFIPLMFLQKCLLYLAAWSKIMFRPAIPGQDLRGNSAIHTPSDLSG